MATANGFRTEKLAESRLIPRRQRAFLCICLAIVFYTLILATGQLQDITIKADYNESIQFDWATKSEVQFKYGAEFVAEFNKVIVGRQGTYLMPQFMNKTVT